VKGSDLLREVQQRRNYLKRHPRVLRSLLSNILSSPGISSPLLQITCRLHFCNNHCVLTTLHIHFHNQDLYLPYLSTCPTSAKLQNTSMWMEKTWNGSS
jgi:hypothetical protein